jgi:hypothetical protein
MPTSAPPFVLDANGGSSGKSMFEKIQLETMHPWKRRTAGPTKALI